MAEVVSAGVGAVVRLHCGACPWVASTLDWETGALRAVEGGRVEARRSSVL